jgi:exonuclease VII small subunit
MTKPKKLSYEEARDELAKTVATLESGGTTLAESMALWKRGEELAAICQAHLDEAKATVEKQTADSEL